MVQLTKNIETISNIRNFFIRLKVMFGSRLILLLTSVFFFQEGFVYSLAYLNQLPYYKNVLKINETQYQIFFIITYSPWTIKAIFGAISDLYPFLGYHKSSYMIISGLFGTISLAILAVINITPNILYLAPALLFILMTELAILDLLCEGRYSKILFVRKIDESDIITWVWICRVLGQLFGGSLIGTIVEHFHPRNVYWICFVASFPALFLILMGSLDESYIEGWVYKFDKNKLKNQWKLFGLAFYIALAAIGMIPVNILQINELVISYSIVVSILLITFGFLLLPKPLAKCNFYIFLQEALYLRIMGALDYWFTADNSCVPNGPNFDMTFYLTITQIIACISGIIGILLFQNYAQTWTYRYSFLFAIFIRVIGSLFDILIISRENIKLGLSDRMVFIFGDAIIMDIAFMLAKMPAILLTARLVHRGYESTIYAILAGFHDMGKSVSISMGTSLMGYLEIDFDSTPCQYKNISLLILISHLILPLFAVPFVFILIPNIRLGDAAAFDEYKIDEEYGDIMHIGHEDIDIEKSSDDVISGGENELPRRKSVNPSE